MTEQVIIEFIPDFTKLDSGLDAVAKTGKVDVSAFKDIQKSIDATANDAQGLVKTFKDVAGASVKMGQSVENAFASGVQDALDEAGVSVNEFADALKKTNPQAVTLKKELQQLKESMARMKAEGKDTGKEFEALRNRAGKLSDAIADANAEIKNAGSDTRNIDNVVGSISALAGGYSALQGATALFGDESEDLQKTLVKVNGAMALASGLQQTVNALQREGALVKLADVVATKAQSFAQSVYASAVGTSTGAMKAFRIAFLAIGIGAIVFVLYEAAKAMGVFGDETKDTADRAADLARNVKTLNDELDNNLNALRRSSALQEEALKQRGATEKQLHTQTISNIKAENELLLKAAQAKVKLLGFEQFVRTKQDAENLLSIKKMAQESGTASKKNQARLDEEVKAVQEVVDAYTKVNQNLDDIEIKSAQFRTQEIIKFNKQRKEALDKLRKETEAGQAEADKNFILGAIARANKEIEQEQIAFDNLQDIEADKRAEYQKTLDAKKKALADGLLAGVEAGIKEVADVKKTEEEKRAEMVKTANQLIDIASKIGSIFGQLGAIQTERDQQLVASKRKAIEEQAKAGIISQKEAEARQKQIDAFEKKARREAAEREKKAALFQAVLAIPQAFLKGLTSAPPPYGAILGGIAAALAAAEAAIIASKPVPRFFRGKKDRYEGPGEVADMGSEIVERGGRMFLYTKPTQTYLGANDKVYTAAETRQIMHNTNASTTIVKDRTFQFDYDRFAKAIPESGININIDQDGIVVLANKAQSRTRYMDKRYSTK